MNKPFFPVALTLEGRLCVVIGDAEDREAIQKTKALEESGATVRRVLDRHDLCHDDLCEAFFVLSTIRDEEFSTRLQRLSELHGFLLWCIDQPQFGSVSMMAIAKSGPVRIGTSTSGVAPAVSKTLRKALERAMDPTFLRFITQLGLLRTNLRAQLPGVHQSTERIEAMLHASQDFNVRVSFTYPDWFK